MERGDILAIVLAGCIVLAAAALLWSAAATGRQAAVCTLCHGGA